MARSSTAQLEERMAALEAEVALLKSRLSESAQPATNLPWWEKIAGRFENDPDYDRAMELGRAYRESLRPKPAKASKAVKSKARKSRNVRARHRSSKSA